VTELDCQAGAAGKVSTPPLRHLRRRCKDFALLWRQRFGMDLHRFSHTRAYGLCACHRRAVLGETQPVI
jgi:hypothetical protein